MVLTYNGLPVAYHQYVAFVLLSVGGEEHGLPDVSIEPMTLRVNEGETAQFMCTAPGKGYGDC